MNSTIDDLQQKMNTISTIVNTNNSIEKNNTNSSTNYNLSDNNIENTTDSSLNNTTEHSINQVQKCLENYLDLNQSIGSELLEKLAKNNVLEYNESDNSIHGITTTTKVKFQDYKKAMLNYVSEKEFEKNWSKKDFEVNKDGYLQYGELGGGTATYKVLNITENSDGSYLAKTSYIVENTPPSNAQDFTFTVIDYNGNCVIDTIK